MAGWHAAIAEVPPLGLCMRWWLHQVNMGPGQRRSGDSQGDAMVARVWWPRARQAGACDHVPVGSRPRRVRRVGLCSSGQIVHRWSWCRVCVGTPGLCAKRVWHHPRRGRLPNYKVKVWTCAQGQGGSDAVPGRCGTLAGRHSWHTMALDGMHKRARLVLCSCGVRPRH